MRPANPVSILYKSIAGRYRPVRVADGPITARYRFIKNADWEDSDQPSHSHSLIKICPSVFWIARDAMFLHTDNNNSNQIARMRRLLSVFVGRTCRVEALIITCELYSP